MSRALRPLLPVLACVALLSGGCSRPRAADTATSPPGGTATDSPGRARSEAFIEAGNQAYRANDFELALKRYAAAAVADPQDPAAYFGMGMTFTRLKREDEARAAFSKARQLSHEARPR
jgi:Tfp pilus assembly protein PilF